MTERNRKHDNNKRRKIKHTVYFNEEEYATITEKADREGLKVSSYLRSRGIKVYSVKHTTSSADEYRDFDEPEPKFTRKGRILPLIPGTPDWKKARMKLLRIELTKELKETLEKRKLKVDYEDLPK